MASPAPPLAFPPWWKKLAFRAFFFGTGVATVCALVVAGFLVYQHHNETKPWTSPMKASFTGMGFKHAPDAITIEIQYAVENPSDKDYQIPYASTIMLLLPENNGYKTGEQAHVILENNAFIPAKQKVNILVKWSLPSTDFTLPSEDFSKSTAFVDRRLSESDGFTIFDQTNRYRIDLPNEWKDWEGVKQILDEEKKKQPPS